LRHEGLRDGHRQADKETEEVVEHREESRDCGAEGGHGPEDGAEVPGTESLPSEVIQERHWRTREDPFSDVWDQVQPQIEENPGLEAKTLFEWLQREHPGRLSDGQMRPLQRRIKLWRATEGPDGVPNAVGS
jgi:hypothetical protein